MNISEISAGGHHSWIIVDDEYPERLDYDMPSPLASPSFTPTQHRSKENSPKNIKNPTNTNIKKNTSYRNITSNIKFNLGILNEKIEKLNSKISLQVAYTDLKICHRFIRFFISKSKSINYKDLNTKISEYFSDDKSVLLFRLQDDNDIHIDPENNLIPSMNMIFKEMRGNFKLLDLNSSNKSSYSLTIIYDYNKNESMSLLKNSIEDLKAKNNVLNNYRTKSICKLIL
jgi:hypothetical protein